MPPSLPSLKSPRARFGDVAADVTAPPWPDLSPYDLLDTVTGALPAQSTQIRVAWDETDFRILFTARDAHPWATLRERDAPLYTEEVVEVFLDPVGDLQSYFEFEVNPLNTVLELVIRRTRRGLVKNFAWQCENLRTAARLTPDGWCAEFAIPHLSLANAPPHPGSTWRANFCRIDRPANQPRELSAWSPTALPQFHIPARFGLLEFTG